jgi:hypothetical protein
MQFYVIFVVVVVVVVVVVDFIFEVIAFNQGNNLVVLLYNPWFKMMRAGSIPRGSVDRQISAFPLLLEVPQRSPRCLCLEGGIGGKGFRSSKQTSPGISSYSRERLSAGFFQ